MRRFADVMSPNLRFFLCLLALCVFVLSLDGACPYPTFRGGTRAALVY